MTETNDQETTAYTVGEPPPGGFIQHGLGFYLDTHLTLLIALQDIQPEEVDILLSLIHI